MPFYEYRCPKCEEPFTLLRRMDERDEPAVCPECGTESAARQLSTFAATVSGGPPASCPSASTCPSAGFS